MPHSAEQGATSRPETIHVSLAADAGYALQLAVALTSLAKAHEPGTCRATVLHRAISPELQARICSGAAAQLDVNWIAVDDAALAGAHFPAFLNVTTLFRLLLPALLPADLDRTIYLDADTVVLDNLTPLWQTDLGDSYLAAVPDASAPWAAGPSGPDWRTLKMQPDSPYFNGGLLVVPLAQWRSDGLADRALAVLRDGKPRWGDQDALNVVAEGRWHRLDRRWNVQTADVDGHAIAWALWPDEVERAVADPAIVHFTDRAKPWTPGAAHPWAGRWYEYVDQTDWAGWRPGAQGQPLYRRIYWRLARAGQVLRSGQ